MSNRRGNKLISHKSEALTEFALDQTPLDVDQIPAALLNIESKERSSLLPWNGQFSPQFVEAILKHYALPQSCIYDPFCGSGTVLYEAGRLGMAAYGVELNPAAFILARTYSLINIPRARRSDLLDAMEKYLAALGCGSGILNEKDESEDVRSDLISLNKSLKGTERVLCEALIVLADFHKGVTRARVQRVWWKLCRVIDRLPHSSETLNVKLGDCRVSTAPERPMNFVLTSPPYINVYNYHQQYRTSTEALGWDLLEVATAEIGSNRKNRANRFLTVIQYCLDMGQALAAMSQMTTDDARFVLVVGRESNVRGVPFYNGNIVGRIAVATLGFEIVLRQERVFLNRFGQHIYEDIIHLRKRSVPLVSPDDLVREVASDVLSEALTRSIPKDVRDDLTSAIAKIPEISASPIYNHMDQK